MTILLAACGGNHGSTTATTDNSATDTAKSTAAVTFNADSAYAMVQRQCDFGPRVPGTAAHAQCAAWLEQTLGGACDKVMVQSANVTTGQGKPLAIKNIVGVINPDATSRLLLLAHWDTRPWADNDPDPTKHNQPVMGANDGASGVGVLLQLARELKQAGTSLGIDIVLVDAEDMGDHDNEDSWALGAQYWAAHPHVEGYKPLFGILLDMVGAPDATFLREYYSLQYASSVVDVVWQQAAGSHFSAAQGGAVTDDHVFVNRAGIPCIDIIDLRSSDTGFFAGWHTTADTMDGIDRATLGEVGQTLMNVIRDLENYNH